MKMTLRKKKRNILVNNTYVFQFFRTFEVSAGTLEILEQVHQHGIFRAIVWYWWFIQNETMSPLYWSVLVCSPRNWCWDCKQSEEEYWSQHLWYALPVLFFAWIFWFHQQWRVPSTTWNGFHFRKIMIIYIILLWPSFDPRLPRMRLFDSSSVSSLDSLTPLLIPHLTLWLLILH